VACATRAPPWKSLKRLKHRNQDTPAPKVYAEAATFFRNTHPPQPLKKTVQPVFERLVNG